jgi:hypothetical protein
MAAERCGAGIGPAMTGCSAWGTNAAADTPTPARRDHGFSGEAPTGAFGPEAGGDTGTLSTAVAAAGRFLQGDDGQWPRAAGELTRWKPSFDATTNGAEGRFQRGPVQSYRLLRAGMRTMFCVIDDQQAEHPETVLLVTEFRATRPGPRP